MKTITETFCPICKRDLIIEGVKCDRCQSFMCPECDRLFNLPDHQYCPSCNNITLNQYSLGAKKGNRLKSWIADRK